MIATFWIGFVVVPMLGLVIETGNWFEHKRHLQTQVDAAALAGGALFGNCFSGTGGSTSIFNEATKYAGATGKWKTTSYGTPIFNAQIGGARTGVVSILYQSPTYADGTNTGDLTETQDPCNTPSLMFDVKGTESNLPWFANWTPFLPGSGGSKCGLVVCAINAHARVQLRGLGDANPSLPLAVPDVNPKKVGVTFVDEATGDALSGCTGPNIVTGTTCTFSMTKGTPSGALNIWSGPANVSLPVAPAKVGVRVGLGSAVGSCANTTGTAQYACYDNGTTSQGLYLIRDYSWGAPITTQPIVDGVWPTTSPTTSAPPCSGSPFFSTVATTPATTCPAGIQAMVDFGTGATIPAASKYQLTATVANADGKKSATVDLAPVPGSYDPTHHAWLWQAANGALSLTTGVGLQPITLDWTVAKATPPICPGTKACTASIANVQRFYSAPVDATGPVKALSVREAGLDASSLTSGSHAFDVTVGISGNYAIHTPCSAPPSGGSYNCSTDRPVLIRFASISGSRTYAVDCGTPAGHTGGDLYQQIHWGCANKFSLNTAGFCPDPSNPSPPDCVPIGNVGSGVKTGQVRQALNDRFVSDPPFNGACAANNYPVIRTGDPRVLIVMITDFSAFEGTGSSASVPVITYGAFYLSGWDGSSAGCDNEPFSHTGETGSSSTGDIWGHFITYVTLGDGSPNPCDPSGLLPCVPVLTQ